MRVGIVGFGQIATSVHLPVYLAHDDFEVVGVADPAMARRLTASRCVPNLPVFRDLDSLLDHVEFDLLDICSPSALHVEQILAGVSAGRHVLCEKPLAFTIADFQRITSAATRTRRVVYPCHNWRFAPAMSRAAELIRGGVIGKPTSAEVRIDRAGCSQGAVDGTPRWRQNALLSGGGVWVDHGPHVIYLAELLLSGHISAVSLRAETAGTPVDQKIAATLVVANKRVVVNLSWLAGRRRTVYCVSGTTGRMIIDHRGVRLERPLCDPELVETDPLDHGLYPAWYRAVIDEIHRPNWQTDSVPRLLAEAERVCLALELGYKSARQDGAQFELPSQSISSGRTNR